MSKDSSLTTIFDHTFKHAKTLARNFYFKEWAKHPPQCPAVQGETINITREGWEHILRERHRTKMDILGRFFNLEIAKYILETATSYQDYRKRGDTEFWIFEAVVGELKARIIVRSIKKGRKHFYSVIRKGSVEKEIEE